MDARWTLVAALLVAMPVAGQTWDDPEGDHRVGYAPTAGEAGTVWLPPGSVDWYPAMDIVAFGISEETKDSLFFRFEVAGEGPALGQPDRGEEYVYRTEFTFHGETHALDLAASTFASLPVHFVNHLIRVDDTWTSVRWWTTPAGDDPREFVLEVPKMWLRDSSEVPVRTGDVLGDIRVRSGPGDFWFQDIGAIPCLDPESGSPSMSFWGCGWTAEDDIDGFRALGDYEVQFSPPHLGSLLWDNERPVRASNGLATTYLYEVELRNVDPDPVRAFVQADGVPEGWQVYLPGVVDVDPEASVTIPVAVSVPFRHEHGAFDGFELLAFQADDPDLRAVTSLYVAWTQVPQPAGHHDTLFLHGQDIGGFAERLWMNAGDDLQADLDVAGPNNGGSCLVCIGGDGDVRAADVEWAWTFPLSPGLAVGLEFDRQGTIQLVLPLDAPFDVEADVDARLLLYFRDQDREPLLLGEAALDAQALPAGRTTLDLDLGLAPEAGRFEAGEAATMAFHVQMVPVEPESATAMVLADSLAGGEGEPRIDLTAARIRLPLLEYHRVIPAEVLALVPEFQVSNATPVAKPANPGDTVHFAFDVHNVGSKSHTLEWSVAGQDSAWAEPVPTASYIAREKNATVLVRVHIPEGIPHGTQAELLLVGTSREDPDKRAFARFVIQVTTTEDVDDDPVEVQGVEEKALASGARDSPGVGGALVVSLLAVAVAMIRRRSP